jgi:hypothetical protein
VLDPLADPYVPSSTEPCGGADGAIGEPQARRSDKSAMITMLGLAAILSWLFGTALLVMPANFYAPAGITLTPLLATVAQAQDSTRVGLGVINWLCRRAGQTQVARVLIGNVVMQGLSLLVVVRTMQLGAGLHVMPGLIIHLTLGSAFSVAARRAAFGRLSSPSPTAAKCCD